MEQLGASLRREVVQEEGRFRQVYISFYTAKSNQLAQRIRQGGNIEFSEVIFEQMGWWHCCQRCQ